MRKISMLLRPAAVLGLCGLLVAAAVCRKGDQDSGPSRAKTSVFDKLAQTPPMGWNSWNKFGCNVDEKIIRGMAEAMVSRGLKAAGYETIVIDDCWQISRDERGDILADPERFPSGIKALAAYIHSLGLKFGLNSCAGTKTCAGRPGSQGYEEQDARQYAAWGVDYLQYDWCHTEGLVAQPAYKKMRAALESAGRPIVFSICEWGRSEPWLWAKGVGHLWRTTGDIEDTWESIIKILDLQAGLESYAGPGHWNDPDMLEVGNGGLTFEESKAHFSLWCLLAAPLMAGNDLRSMTKEAAFILTNKDVIAVDQDKLGVQGRRLRKDGSVEVWVKPLTDGSKAVVLLNRGLAPAIVSVSWKELGVETSTAEVRDLWLRSDQGRFLSGYLAKVPSHGVVMVKVKASNIVL